MFEAVWFSYLKSELHFVERMRDLAPYVQDCLKRVLEFLIAENILNDKNESIWAKSWQVINSFYPSLKDTVVN